MLYSNHKTCKSAFQIPQYAAVSQTLFVIIPIFGLAPIFLQFSSSPKFVKELLMDQTP